MIDCSINDDQLDEWEDLDRTATLGLGGVADAGRGEAHGER